MLSDDLCLLLPSNGEVNFFFVRKMCMWYSSFQTFAQCTSECGSFVNVVDWNIVIGIDLINRKITVAINHCYQAWIWTVSTTVALQTSGGYLVSCQIFFWRGGGVIFAVKHFQQRWICTWWGVLFCCCEISTLNKGDTFCGMELGRVERLVWGWVAILLPRQQLGPLVFVGRVT